MLPQSTTWVDVTGSEAQNVSGRLSTNGQIAVNGVDHHTITSTAVTDAGVSTSAGAATHAPEGIFSAPAGAV